MQLIYIYIKRFRNLQNIPVALSPVYNVSFDSRDGVLSVEKKGQDIAKTLYPNHILSVDALVGRNATGKTNFLDVIALPSRTRYATNVWTEGEAASYFLLYAEEIDEPTTLYYIECMAENQSDALLQELFSTDEGPWRVGWFRAHSTGRLFPSANQNVPHRTCVVSLREHFNKQYYDPEGKESTEHIYYNERDEREEASTRETSIVRIGGMYACGSLFHKLMTFNELYPIFHETNGVSTENASLLNDIDYHIALTWNHCAVLNPSWFPGIEQESFSSLPYFRRFALHTLCQVIQLMMSGNEPIWMVNENQYHSFQILLEKAFSDEDGMFWSMLAGFIDETLPLLFLSSFDHRKKEWLYNLISALKSLSEGILRIEGDAIHIPVYPASESLIKISPLLNCCTEESRGILEWIWLNTSDGEQHLLQGFASLRQLLEKAITSSGNYPTDCILLLDEPEQHSHPELARSFLLYLTRWLECVASQVAGNVQTVRYQIILTTHSPFLLSDIVREHTLLFRRSTDNAVMVDNPKSQTFAANIHDILHDSIFLEHSFGAVAYKNLQALMEKLIGNRQSKISSTDKNLIGLIGESILRGAFYQLLNERP